MTWRSGALAVERPGGLFGGTQRPPGLTGGVWDLFGGAPAAASMRERRLPGIIRTKTTLVRPASSDHDSQAITPLAYGPVALDCLHHNEGRQAQVRMIW